MVGPWPRFLLNKPLMKVYEIQGYYLSPLYSVCTLYHDVSWSRAQSQSRHFTRKYNCVPFQSSKPRPNKRKYRYWQLYRLRHTISSYRELAFLYQVSMLKRFPYSLVFSMSCTVVAARASFCAFAHRLREMVHNLAWDLLIDRSQA